VIVGGAVLALILVGVAVFFLLKRRRAQEPAINNKAAELKQPQSNYAAINVSPPKEYDQGRLDSNEPAPSNYAVIPAKSSDYDNGRMNVDGAAAASEYNVGRLS
jgi:ribosomal protein L18E